MSTVLDSVQQQQPLYRRGPSPARYPVHVDVFTQSMGAHWSTLGNVVSPELEAIWTKLCITLNRQVLQHGTVEGDRWQVFPAELGSGKTEGLKLYCSLIPDDIEHPGVLIIVRLKKQADEIAEDICTWRKDNRAAVAYHGDHKLPLDALNTYPVLVITHSAYERGLEAMAKGRTDQTVKKWEHLHAFGLEGRKLIVIDEALDLIREERATLQNLRHLRGVLPDHLQVKHKDAVHALDAIVVALSAYADTRQRERRAQPVASLPDLVDFGPLWDDLSKNTRWPSSLIFGSPDDPGSAEKARRRFFSRLKLTLSGAQALLERWHWYYFKLGDHTLTTSYSCSPTKASTEP